MSTYIGPNGRAYRRASHKARWVAATILCISVISAAIVGESNIAIAFRYLGL